MTKAEKEKLRGLIKQHNDLCDKFDREIREVMNKINSICEPLGLYTSRIWEYEDGIRVTRVYINDPRSLPNIDIDEKWLEILWAEDDMTFRRR